MPPWTGRVCSARTGKPWAGGGTRAAARLKKFAHHRRFQKSTGAKGAGRPCAGAAPEEKERCLLRQTANYQLSQWDPEDRILREDFNRDNEKIDGAIAGANPLQSLGTVVLEQDGSELDLDLSGVDWDLYWEVRVYFELAGTANGSLQILFNHATSGYFNSLGNTSSNLAGFSLSESTMQGCLCIYRHGTSAGVSIRVAVQGSVDLSGYFASGALDSLNFVFDRPMKAGGRAWLCGLKK